MDIETSNAIRHFFPNPSLVQVYFEAVANSLDAGATEIDIAITTLGSTTKKGFDITITDNGSGFTDESFARIQKLLKPQDAFHKGLGRLVYINYFSTVNITSIFGQNERKFVFSSTFDGKSDLRKLDEPAPRKTALHFTGFIGDRVKSLDDIKPEPLKERLIEQFLPYFYRLKREQKKFRITIDLQTQESNAAKDFFSNAASITPADLPDLKTIQIKETSISAFDNITINYAVVAETGTKKNLTAVCVDDRTIAINLLPPASIPIDHSVIFLFESPLFKGSTDSARQKLVLPDDISQNDLIRVLRRETSKILNSELPEINKKNEETKKKFEEKFPHLSGYFEETSVGIINKDEALDIAQRNFFKAQKEILESDTLDDRTYEKSLDISSRTLTQYVLYRELIIKRLREISDVDLEAKVHDLIVPRGSLLCGNEIIDSLHSNNAWLLDDKFMSFRTILSESEMKNVVAAITLSSQGNEAGDTRPDISMIFSADPKSVGKVDVVIVEVKRKRDSDKENTFAAVQLLQRARKLIDFCSNIQRAWYFGIIKINDELEQYLRDDAWTPLYSKGKVFYRERTLERPGKPPVPVPLCLLSFDAVIDDAAARNHTFLEILRSEIKRTTTSPSAEEDRNNQSPTAATSPHP